MLTVPAAVMTAATLTPAAMGALPACDLVLGIVPRAARVPSDMAELATAATLAFCPVRGASRRAREDHIAGLISSSLAMAA